MKNYEITLTKMSTNYFKTLSWALDKYGAMLKTNAELDTFSNEAIAYSICLETYFLLEPKISKKQLLKPENEQKRQNKRLKIPMHAGIVIIDSFWYTDSEKDFSMSPAIEHIKEQITKQLL